MKAGIDGAGQVGGDDHEIGYEQDDGRELGQVGIDGRPVNDKADQDYGEYHEIRRDIEMVLDQSPQREKDDHAGKHPEKNLFSRVTKLVFHGDDTEYPCGDQKEFG